MSINITTRLAKFEDLVPSTIPFVEGKLKGHQDRKNYSVIGPGVSEDAKQNVKIAEAHGFNIGAVSAAPMNGSGLHSHTTAEVFIIHSGAWRFYWGVDGTEGEVILYKGDVASFPTNMFRGFQNVSDEEALMFVVLGENDPGVITWTPKLLKEAKKSGMVLLDDNSLIDTEKNKIVDENKIIQPLRDKELETFDHYTSSEIEKFVIRLSDRDKYLVDDEHFNSNKIINYLDKFNIHISHLIPIFLIKLALVFLCLMEKMLMYMNIHLRNQKYYIAYLAVGKLIVMDKKLSLIQEIPFRYQKIQQDLYNR